MAKRITKVHRALLDELVIYGREKILRAVKGNGKPGRPPDQEDEKWSNDSKMWFAVKLKWNGQRGYFITACKDVAEENTQAGDKISERKIREAFDLVEKRLAADPQLKQVSEAMLGHARGLQGEYVPDRARRGRRIIPYPHD
jgi:hypothetical protein